MSLLPGGAVVPSYDERSQDHESLRQTVSLTLPWATRFECFMKSDPASWSRFVESQCEKDFRWHAFMDKLRNVLEAKLLVILGVSHEATATSVHALQP